MAIKLGSSSSQHNIKLNDLISDIAVVHYVYKRPFLGKKKDFNPKELKDLFITNELQILIVEIEEKKPV